MSDRLGPALGLLRALGVMARLDPYISAQEVAAFMLIGLNEGASIAEVGDALGVARCRGSRIVSRLGDGLRGGAVPGLGLVRAEAWEATRAVKVVSLTEPGRALFERVCAEVAAARGVGDAGRRPPPRRE